MREEQAVSCTGRTDTRFPWTRARFEVNLRFILIFFVLQIFFLNCCGEAFLFVEQNFEEKEHNVHLQWN